MDCNISQTDDFDKATGELQAVYGEDRITHKDVLSHALYPDVFKDWLVFENLYILGRNCGRSFVSFRFVSFRFGITYPVSRIR